MCVSYEQNCYLGNMKYNREKLCEYILLINKKIVVLGVGNVLQKDDGIGVYTSEYLIQNYTFFPEIKIINGGVLGINLLDIFIENDEIIILDTISLNDSAGAIYNIPSKELGGYGLNSGSAHEIGVLQCLDMLDLQEIARPKSNVIAIVPKEIIFDFGLSKIVYDKFEDYLKVIIDDLKHRGIKVWKKDNISLEKIITKFQNPSNV